MASMAIQHSRARSAINVRFAAVWLISKMQPAVRCTVVLLVETRRGMPVRVRSAVAYTRLCGVLGVCAVLCGCASARVGQGKDAAPLNLTYRLDAWLPVDAFVLRLREVEHSLQSDPLPSWAGLYAQGVRSISIVMLAIAPDGGVAALVCGDLGDSPENYGNVVQVTKDVLRIAWVEPLAEGETVLAEEYQRARVGRYECLVRAADMERFCDAANLGVGDPYEGEPIPWCLERYYPEQEWAPRKVHVPAQYKHLILRRPIYPVVISESAGWDDSLKRTQYILTLDAGRKDGMRPGLALVAFGKRRWAQRYDGWMNVTDVSESRSTAVFSPCDPAGTDHRPKPGDRLSTRFADP
jgi:hypothetical protein